MLDKIVAYKLEQLDLIKSRVSYKSLEKLIYSLDTPCKDFAGALKRDPKVALIGEVKKASPSKGIFRVDFNPLEIAKIYTEAGVDAISVLTEDKFFMGNINYLSDIRKVTNLPLLRKDFIIDPYQILEARVNGADAVLLIAAILEKSKLKSFINLAEDLGMSALVEVHNEKELTKVLDSSARIIGINNRNLKTFETNIETTFKLQKMITGEGRTVVSESGIKCFTDVLRLQEKNIDAMLVGETLMRGSDIRLAISSLTGRRSA